MSAGLCAVVGCGRRATHRGWCHSHYERRRRGESVGGPIADSPEKRFWAKVDTSGDCWIWMGAATRRGGYGRFYWKGQLQVAHRVSFEMSTGVPLPTDLSLDHLCRMTLCVRPDHLDPVSHAENVRRGDSRKTHCASGHEFTPENTRWVCQTKRNYRQCVECLLAKRHPDELRRLIAEVREREAGAA